VIEEKRNRGADLPCLVPGKPIALPCRSREQNQRRGLKKGRSLDSSREPTSLTCRRITSDPVGKGVVGVLYRKGKKVSELPDSAIGVNKASARGRGAEGRSASNLQKSRKV